MADVSCPTLVRSAPFGMPTIARRLVLFGLAVTMGIIGALCLGAFIWRDGAGFCWLLAFAAGVSALWSP